MARTELTDRSKDLEDDQLEDDHLEDNELEDNELEAISGGAGRRATSRGLSKLGQVNPVRPGGLQGQVTPVRPGGLGKR